MKTLLKSYFTLLVLIVPHLLVAQDKVSLSLNYGFPELLSLGVRYQFPQVQIGASAGFLSEYHQVSGDIFVHFAGHAYASERKPWFLHTGVMFFQEKLDYTTTKCTFVPLRIGRDLNLTEKAGFVIDFGMALKLSEKTNNNAPSSSWPGYAVSGMLGNAEGDSFPGIMPCFGLGFFYKF